MSTCAEIRADAAELALGVLDGEERARVLDHARGCPACRAHLDELAMVAQEVLTAAPDHEPPPGFESRVLEALPADGPRPATRRRRGRPLRRRRLLAPALATALVLAAAGGATLGALSATRDDRRLGAYYRDVLAQAGGTYFTAAELRDGAGARHGVVFLYQGDQPWLAVVLASSGPGPWSVAVVTRDGDARELGRFEPATAGRVWGHALPVAVREIASVRVTSADGHELHARRRAPR